MNASEFLALLQRFDIVLVGKTEPALRGKIIPDLARQHGIEYLGQGVDRFTIGIPNQPDRVVVVHFHDLDPQDAQKMVSINVIASTLRPHNFPRIYETIPRSNPYQQTVAGFIVERINPDNSEIQYPIDEAIRTLWQIGCPLEIDTVLGIGNFLGANGGEYYVDIVEMTRRGFNKSKILQYMQENSYTEEQMQTVTTAIDKLHAISPPRVSEEDLE